MGHPVDIWGQTDNNLPFLPEVVALDIEDINPTLERMLRPKEDDEIGIPDI